MTRDELEHFENLCSKNSWIACVSVKPVLQTIAAQRQVIEQVKRDYTQGLAKRDVEIRDLKQTIEQHAQEIGRLREVLNGLLTSWRIDHGDAEGATLWMQAMSKALQQAQAALRQSQASDSGKATEERETNP